MFTASNLLFSSRISFTALNFSSFRNEFIFRLLPSQKAITPASVDVKSGGNFASFCKICDAFYGQLEAIVMHFLAKNTMNDFDDNSKVYLYLLPLWSF
jgi:hypothetical protein